MSKKSDEAKIVSVAKKTGGSVYADYSGRGMYGRECMGIVHADANEVIAEAGAAGLKGAKTDSMGRKMIIYWPHVKAAEHTKDEDCAGHIVDGCCAVCGVGHGDGCVECAGTGYHKEGCSLIG